MISVRTGSRLHFGLFSLPSEQAGPWLNQEGQSTIPRRQFGGVGLMIEKPGIELTVEKADKWSAEGPLADRALHFARLYCNHTGDTDKFRIQIEAAAPEHVGLGTGTQLGLAIALAICNPYELIGMGSTLADDIGRGIRSQIGVYGFDHGGLIVEGGKASGEVRAPLLFREYFWDDWSILLIVPHGLQGAHGKREVDAFAELADRGCDDHATEALCRVVLLSLIPALKEHDLPTFGEALYDFNCRAGAMFASAQGGIYAHPRVEKTVKFLRGAGVKGVGQSSWGPTVFAIVESERIAELREWLIQKGGIASAEITATRAWNQGKVFADK
jgi:beta-RFAP synthase